MTPFEKNIAAFSAKYPRQWLRISQYVNEPTDYTWPEPGEVETSVENIPPDYPPRILIIKGLGGPDYLNKIIWADIFQHNTFLFLIVEKDRERIKAFFQKLNSSAIINDPKVKLFLDLEINEIEPTFFNLLKVNSISAFMENAIVTMPADNKKEELKPYYEQVEYAYSRAIKHVYHNYGQIDDSLDGVKASLANIEQVATTAGIRELKGFYKGKPGIVIGAGPSLDAALPKLKEIEDKVVIFAVDAALKPLKSAGIEPNFVVGLERENLWQVKFYEDLPPLEKAELICYPVLHPKVLEAYPGRIRFVYRNYSYYVFFESQWPKGNLSSGGSAGHLATQLAYYMGCNPVAILGCDSTYGVNEQGLVRSHCSNGAYPQWGEFKPINELMMERRHHGDPLQVLTNDGFVTVTSETYYQWGQEFAEMALSLPYPPLNLSDKGMAMPGLPYMPIEKFISTYLVDTIDATRPYTANKGSESPEAAIQLLNGNFVATLKEIEAMKLLVGETVSAEEVTDLHALFQARCYEDNLFVSFVTQCCGLEAFEFENEWLKFSLTGKDQFEERKALLLKKLDLAILVVTKLLTIFDNYLKEPHEQIS